MILEKRYEVDSKNCWLKLFAKDAAKPYGQYLLCSGHLQLVRAINHSTVFSTFEMDQLGKIRRHHWKERL